MKAASVIIQFGNLSASAESDSGARHLGRGKPVALLAFLAASPGRRASRERLATLLWSEGSTEQARQNLRQTLWYIRRRLGPWLQTSDDFVELLPDVESDRDLFLTAAREHRLRDAIAAYAGPFIPDFAAPGAAEFEEWADIERRRLRAIFTGCCDTLARQALGAGQFTTAVELARRARDEAPMELATWRLLLEALSAARDTVACLAEAEHLEAMLSANELDPDDATRAALRIARATATSKPNGRSTPDAAAKAVPSADEDASSLAPELIGRESEFRALLERWDATKDGKGGAVLLSGVAGLGKSRLLADLHSRLRASRAKAILVRANPGDRAVGGGFLAAVSEVVAQRPGARAISSDSASVLVALAPALASVFPQARPDQATGEDAVRRRVGALLDLLRAVSDESALALLIDDLHWIDPESRRVLDAVAARLDGGRVFMVLASRPPLDAVGGFAALPRFELTRFDTQRIAEFVARLGELPADDWAMELPAQLLAATQGIPLTLIEALQRLLETGAVALEGHQWTSAASGRIAETLRQGMVLEARVRSLSPGAREVLLLLSTAGRPISPEALRAGMQIAPAEGDDSRLVELEHRGFVSRSGSELQVAHDEIAAATVASASAAERVAAHRTAARALLSVSPSDATLRLAVEHAMHSGDASLLREIALRWVRRRRDEGDGASAPVLIRDFTPGAPADVQRRLVQAVPWMERPARAVVRMAAVALLLLVGAFGWTRVQRGVPEDMVIYALMEGTPARYLRVAWRQGDSWSADEPLEAEEVAREELPVAADSIGRGLVVRLPDGSGWLGSTTFPDSLGDEVVLFTSEGKMTRPVSHAGDDGGGTPSPDGSRFVFASARWHPRTDRYNLGIFDRASGRVRRIFASDTYDSSPMWSPDGTRIAFSRKSLTELVPVRICIGSVDEVSLRCEWPTLDRDLFLVAWADDQHLVVEDDQQQLFSIGTDDGVVAPLSSPKVHVSPILGTTLAWFNADPTMQGGVHLRIAQLEGRLLTRPVTLGGVPVLATPLAVEAPARPTYVARVRVGVPSDGVQIGQSHRLRLDAFDSSGAAVRAHAVRFQSLDDSIATVVDGTLRGYRLGVVRVVGTAGGWRTDTAEIRIVESSAVTIVSERWGNDWTSRWTPFGEPLPRLARGDGGTAISTNGDGSYASGMYLRRELPVESGVGVEFRISLPLTDLFQWQEAVVDLVSEGSLERIAAWDHRSGKIPMPSLMACSAALGGEGVVARRQLRLQTVDAASVTAPTPAGLYDGSWHTLRLQLLPDGRCGLAVDGRVVMLSPTARRVRGPLLLVLTGHSVETDVLFGRMEVWTGVKGGVDWEGKP